MGTGGGSSGFEDCQLRSACRAAPVPGRWRRSPGMAESFPQIPAGKQRFEPAGRKTVSAAPISRAERAPNNARREMWTRHCTPPTTVDPAGSGFTFARGLAVAAWRGDSPEVRGLSALVQTRIRHSDKEPLCTSRSGDILLPSGCLSVSKTRAGVTLRQGNGASAHAFGGHYPTGERFLAESRA